MGDQNIVATFNIPASFQEPNKNPTNGTTNHSNELIGGPTPPVTSVTSAATIITTASPAPISNISTPLPTTKSWSGNPPNSNSSTVKNNNSNVNNKGGNNATPHNSSNSKKNKKKQQQLQQQQQEEEDGVKKRRKNWAPEDQKYACDKCNFRSAYASSLGRHRASSHKSDSTAKDVNESSSGSTNSSTPAQAVTPTPPTPTATPTPTPITATILTIPKVEVPMQVHAVTPMMEDVNFRHQPPPPQHHAPLTYEYHGSSSSSTFQDVVNTPPVYNTSVRFEPNDGIPITLMEQTNYNSLSHNESEYLPFQKSEEEMATIRAEPTVLTTLSTLAVPVNDIITLPPQSTTLTPLTSAENNRETISVNPDGTQRKRPLVNAKSKGEDNAGGVATKKRKKEENAPTFTVLGGPSLPNNQGNKTGPPSTSPPKRPKKKKTAGNNQGAVTGNANSGNIKSESSMSNFSNSSNSGFSRGKSDDKGKNGDGESGGKKKRQKRKPSDKPSNPCMITSTSSSCPVCNFTTKYQFNLARHFQATHKTELQAILDGTKSFPGIRKREIREKTPKTKPKAEKKAKRPPPSAGNEQGNHNSQYSGNQREPRTLSVAQEFEQFVRDENLEMFAEADNLDFSEPMVSSFIESLFSTDMGNEGWNNVNSHGVVLNPSVHPQTIATTATYIHPQPTSGLQTVGQSSYVTTVDLLPTHPTQTQVVGNFIQPQLYSEFQKPPHSNPIQANVVINGVTTTMDLNVIEKNARQLHSQPENPPHQSQSKVFIAQSLESHSGVALELNCPPQYEVQSNGFRGQLPTTRASMPDQQQHQQVQHKWISLSQPQNASTPGSGGNNVDIQWGGNVFQIQGSAYQGNPSQPQYHNPEMVTEVRAVELGGVDNSYLYTSWPPQQPNSTIQQHIPVTQHTQGFSVIPQQSMGVIKTEMNVASSMPVEPTVSPVSTVDTSFLHAAIADKSHLTNLPQGTPAAKENATNQPSLVKSNQSISKPPSRSKEQTEDEKEAARKLRLEKRREKYKLAAERKKGTQHNTEPVVKVETKPVEENPPPTPTTTKKTRVDVEALPPEEREKRQRYLQKRRERWKAAQEKKKLLKQESDSLSGHPSSNSASISGSDSNISPAGLASSASISFLDASNSDSVKQFGFDPPTLSLPSFSMQRLPYPVVPGNNYIPQDFQRFSVHTLQKIPNQFSPPTQLPTSQYSTSSFSSNNYIPQLVPFNPHSSFPATDFKRAMTDGSDLGQKMSHEPPTVLSSSSSRNTGSAKLTHEQLELRRQKQREYKKRKRDERFNASKFVPIPVATKSKQNKGKMDLAADAVQGETMKGLSHNFPGTWGLLGGMPQPSTYAPQDPVQLGANIVADSMPKHLSDKVGPCPPVDSSRIEVMRNSNIAMPAATAVVKEIIAPQNKEELKRDAAAFNEKKFAHASLTVPQPTSTETPSSLPPTSQKQKQGKRKKPVDQFTGLSVEEKKRIRKERAIAARQEKNKMLATLKQDMEVRRLAVGGTQLESNLGSKIEGKKPAGGKSAWNITIDVGSLESSNPHSTYLATNVGDALQHQNKNTKSEVATEAFGVVPFESNQIETSNIAMPATVVWEQKCLLSPPIATVGQLDKLKPQLAATNRQTKNVKSKVRSTSAGITMPPDVTVNDMTVTTMPKKSCKKRAILKSGLLIHNADASLHANQESPLLLSEPKTSSKKAVKPTKQPSRKQDVVCTDTGPIGSKPAQTISKGARRGKKGVKKPLTEAELKKIVKLGCDDLKIPCVMDGCSFVGNTQFEMEFHLSCHSAVCSLPPFFKSIVEATGEVPKIFELRPTPGALLDVNTPSPANQSDISSDVYSDVGSSENKESEVILEKDAEASETVVLEI